MTKLGKKKTRVPHPPVQVPPTCQGGQFLVLCQEVLDAQVDQPEMVCTLQNLFLHLLKHDDLWREQS